MVFWWAWLIFGILVFVSLNAVILPKLLLSGSYGIADTGDRGIKTIDEIGGRSIIYEPSLAARKYIKQYILSERQGNKVIVCMVADGIKYIDYDVVVFDHFGKVYKIINAKEIVGEGKVTSTINLPDETSYVTIIVKCANEQKFSTKYVKQVAKKKLIIYCVLSGVSVILATTFIKYCMAKIFGDLFDESFLISGYSTLVTVAVCVVLVSLNVLGATIIIKAKNKAYKGGDNG